MSRVLMKVVICLLLLLLSSSVPVAIAQERTEHESLLEAVFIYNFAKFTRWPEGTWIGTGVPLTLCVIGQDEVIAPLEQLAGKAIKGHTVSVQVLKGRVIPGNCHVLYVASSEQKRYSDIVASVRGEPILTISELPDFVSAGGIIGMYHDEGRIRFRINLGLAREAGLEFSSRLLNLAVVVDHKEAP